MDQWYYAAAGQQMGPVSADYLRQMVAVGQLTPADYVWREGMADWQAMSNIPELGVSQSYPAQPYAGQAYAQQDYPQAVPLDYQHPYQPPAYSDATSHYSTKFKGDQHAGTASTALTLSIIGLFCAGVILGPIALAMGISALNGMGRSRTSKGKGQAITAIVLGGLETLGAVALVVMIASSELD